MSEDSDEIDVNIDGVSYKLESLSQEAKEHLTNVQFIDQKIQQLSNEWAVADTARIGYTRALEAELSSLKSEK